MAHPRRTAVITASYSKDYERCAILCESVDQHLEGDWTHYLLVAGADVRLFQTLEGPRRHVIDERDLLPWWLKAAPSWMTYKGRALWLTPFSPPLRGWHVQQLRRLAISRHLSEAAMFSIDSDVIMVRDFDPAMLWHGNDLMLYRRDGNITGNHTDHLKWLAHSDTLLTLPSPALPAHDYINTMIAWRTDTCRALLDSIKTRHHRHWVRAVLASRSFSECQIYGRYADETLHGKGHFVTDQALCHVLWDDDTVALDERGLRQFLRDLAPHQIGIGIQSFLGFNARDIQRLAAQEIR